MISWSPDDTRMAVLKQSFDSLKKCTKRPHTLIVVDNGPPAQTAWLDEQEIDIHIVNEVNLGIGASRNAGAKSTTSEYIAFVDNDISYFDGWLNECVGVLQKYPDRKLISTPRKSSPMKHKKHHVGNLDDFHLYNRASGQALVMRRETYETIGWSTRNTPGGIFSDTARRCGYLFIHNPNWKARHLCRRPSYNYKHKLENGIWRAANE